MGKAKRSDLTGHFPGEQAEYGSALARFLEGSGQMKSLDDGTYLDSVSGNGNGSSTEIPRNQTEVPTRSSDTEVAPAPGGNGRHDDNGSDTLFDNGFAQDDLIPEPAFEPEPMQPELLSPAPLEPSNGETSELEPVTFEPSADTLHAEDEPELLDSVPDLTSPELDTSDDDEDEDDDTDILDRATGLPTVSPHTDELPARQEAEALAPADSSDTGMLIAEAFSPPAEGSWDGVDFDDDDEDGRITDKIRMSTPEDEDLTAIHPGRRDVDGEKITNKVEPRRDVDPRAADPNAVVRDTVNFYNQTQSFQEQKKASGGFPTISPKVVNSAQPLGLNPEDAGEPSVPDLFSEDESDTDTLKPGPIQELAPAAELSPLGSEDETRIVLPRELQAEADIEDADRRETDRFKEDDRRPPPLPQPEGTDKLDKEQAAVEKAAAQGAEPQGLEPLADEKVASGKDTQRFYVAEILAKKDGHTGDTTAELQPAQEGLPPGAGSSGETSADYQTESAKSNETRREPRSKPEPLPTPSQVHTDFQHKLAPGPSERIVPEIQADAELESEFDAGFEPGPEYEPSLLGDGEDEQDGDDTVDEEAAIDLPAGDGAYHADEPRITEKVKRETEARERRDTDEFGTVYEEPLPAPPRKVAARREPAVAAAASSERVKRITDSLSQRLKLEREETLRLIEQAEAVAVKLREASEQSRTDLVALSARRAEISSRPVASVPETTSAYDSVDDHAGTDLEELPVEPKTGIRQPAEAAKAEPAPSRRSPNRVPTSAIGEIISDIERAARSQPISLTELLDEVSRRQPGAPSNGHEEAGGNGKTVHDHAEADEEADDMDLFVAASGRWRELLERDREEEDDDSVQVAKHSRRHSARAPMEHEPEHEPEAPRPAAASSRLASDLDRLWEVLDSRRTATVVLPASERSRVAPAEKEIWEGWTQEMLWPTLAGIAGVTFALGALFVWVLMKWAA
ncbi:MAG: hypothetical protein KDB82_05850 [Planctomycetes bacterium]|nr:hypothetical protein [Planctomycetota bacterium]